MNINELVNELAEKLKKFRTKSYKVSFSEREAGDAVFVQRKEESFINPKYLKLINYFEIMGLEEFAKENQELTQENLDEILEFKKVDFAFLRELNNSIDNMLEELNKHGAKAVAIIHVNNMLYPKQENSI